jgi:oligoribonuclease NrnB/cAMP/cGMP phosphodiesterase (DHH superfamily)
MSYLLNFDYELEHSSSSSSDSFMFSDSSEERDYYDYHECLSDDSYYKELYGDPETYYEYLERMEREQIFWDEEEARILKEEDIERFWLVKRIMKRYLVRDILRLIY